METLKMLKGVVLCAIASATLASLPASAAVVFDSQALGEPYCAAGAQCYSETRSSGGNYGAVLQFSVDVTANQIGIYSSVNDPQNIKFLIFDSALNGGTGDLLFSQQKFYAAQPSGWLYTDPMSFTFKAGHTYDIGILGDGLNLTGRWLAYQNLSSGGITEIANNANFYDFNAPYTGGYAGVSPWIQISAVPEPETYAMFMAGLGLLGAMARRKTQK